jgi:adenine-specific DNA glycosylase
MWEFLRAPARVGPEWIGAFGAFDWIEPIGSIKHVVTHHRIRLTAYLVQCNNPLDGLSWMAEGELKTMPMPAPQRRILALAKQALKSSGAPHLDL